MIELKPETAVFLRHMDERLVSYNIEMAEITGGTFWKEYTPEQIAGTEVFPGIKSMQEITETEKLMQYYPPVNLYNKRLRALAKELSPAWIRVSGTWATKTYYDFEDTGKVPEGYENLLTREQWIGVLDFVKSVGGRLLISVSNCIGDHPNGSPLVLTQAQKIFNFSHSYGVDIDAVEFMNEPNMLSLSGAPKGYTAADYARDQDILYTWVREHYPNCLLAGPCTTGDPKISADCGGFGAGINKMIKACTTQELLSGTNTELDVFSYHCYNGVSERLSSLVPEAHWSDNQALSRDYLFIAADYAKAHIPLRDQYVPGGQMWVTEAGDAVGGGDTWASTYLDVFRTLNELGSFSELTDGIIFHNTLASSDYGFLKHGTFEPRPDYFAALLWNRLMGSAVYQKSFSGSDEIPVYCHSRRDGSDGFVYLIINHTTADTVAVQIPKAADCYMLSAEQIRSDTMKLNGRCLNLSEAGDLPELKSDRLEAGTFLLAPKTCAFLVL
ncbi:MAG: beta-glucuronidase [Eubacteriales bacterium]|nr:beta-glucuronidase [Eubacteriales bacterium]